MTILKEIKLEADDINKYRMTMALSLKGVDEGCNAFKLCFSLSKRATSESSDCYNYMEADAAPWEKVVEKRDTFVDNKDEQSRPTEEESGHT